MLLLLLLSQVLLILGFPVIDRPVLDPLDLLHQDSSGIRKIVDFARIDVSQIAAGDGEPFGLQIVQDPLGISRPDIDIAFVDFTGPEQFDFQPLAQAAPLEAPMKVSYWELSEVTTPHRRPIVSKKFFALNIFENFFEKTFLLFKVCFLLIKQ